MSDAIDKYLDEVGSEYGTTKRYALLLIKKLPIARNIITKIHSTHLAKHVALRRRGVPNLGLEPIASTQQYELLHIKGVLSHASVMWGMEEAELTRLWRQDYDSYNSSWKVYDLKNLSSSKGNHKSFYVLEPRKNNN